MCLHIIKNHYNKTKTIKITKSHLVDLASLCATNKSLPNERFSFVISALNLGNWANNCKGKLRPVLISYKQAIRCFNIAFVTIGSTQACRVWDMAVSVVAGSWGGATVSQTRARANASVLITKKTHSVIFVSFFFEWSVPGFITTTRLVIWMFPKRLIMQPGKFDFHCFCLFRLLNNNELAEL